MALPGPWWRARRGARRPRLPGLRAAPRAAGRHRLDGPEAARLVEPGGWLLLSVPALPALWSELDEAAGHRCRYTRPLLEAELSRQAWRLVHWTHYQLALLPLLWAVRRAPWRAGRRVERRPPRALGRLLGAVDALEVRALGRLRLPWGSSLVALARNGAR